MGVVVAAAGNAKNSLGARKSNGGSNLTKKRTSGYRARKASVGGRKVLKAPPPRPQEARARLRDLGEVQGREEGPPADGSLRRPATRTCHSNSSPSLSFTSLGEKR